MSKNESTATYLLRQFLASDRSHEFPLLPIDIVILYTICRYLDMPIGKCFAKQSVLARECRIKKQYFSDRCYFLQKNGLIFRFTKGKLYNYELGYEITLIDN